MTEDRTHGGARTDTDASLKVIEWEYQAVKAEQTQRIGFRDNMLFVQLAAVGGVVSWSLTHLGDTYGLQALLIVPWVCAILGWAYLVNDHAVSRIGRYAREVLTPRITPLASLPPITITGDDGAKHTIVEVFGWGPFHRSDTRRTSRKAIQLAVDLLTFILPGVVALSVFWTFGARVHPRLEFMAVLVESGMLLCLTFSIIVYADLGKGPSGR